MAIEPGQTLLHYRVVDKLGEGGMGVVWKAVDTTLDRTVALKLLPETFAADAERLGRFEREAKSLAALNHAHIAGIYGLHQSGNDRFIAMEFVEGEDLSRRLERGPLQVEEAVAVATAVADALATAHGNGVVHRDLKPANVMLTAEGEPKVLDFGLAKAIAPDGTISGSPTGPDFSPTVTSFGTVAGVILGTAAYMSPEQARGRPVDKRADIWALGAMLYEMLTGKPPFRGETVSDTLASVLKDEPDWDALPANVPPTVRRLVRRSLEKNPKHRLHDAADVRIELTHAFDEDAPAAAALAAAPRSRTSLAVLGVLALLAGTVIGFALRGGDRTGAPPVERVVSSLLAPPGVRLDLRELPLAMSPDGEQVAFVGLGPEGRSHLYIRRLDATDVRRLDGTEGAVTPFWSPDGRSVGFHVGPRLMRMPVEGGTPQLITEGSGRDGAWRSDGTILFGSDNGGVLLRADADGGEAMIVEGTAFGTGFSVMTPQFLPDEKHFIFQVQATGGGQGGIYLSKLGDREPTRLVEGLWNGAYAEGHLLFFRDDTLWAQRLDVAGRRLVGEPQTVAGPIMHLNYPFHGFFAVAPTGNRIAFLEGLAGTGARNAEIVWVDRSGDELERPGIVGDIYNPRLSKDRRRLALDVSTTETHGDIWIFDLARGSSRQLTRDPIDESRPTWSRDDSRLYFFKVPDLYQIDVGSSVEPEKILESPNRKVLTDLSPDGGLAIFMENVAGQYDIKTLDLETGDVREWLATELTERAPRFSPDGRWVAYASLESGQLQVYIDGFPDRIERFRISPDGGDWPVWRDDGRELFYYSATGELMGVPIDMGSSGNPIGKPQKLFAANLRHGYFDVSADGQRFLLVEEKAGPAITSISLLQNWTASLAPTSTD